ncbi:hypothetical protein GCM10020220_109880 [Nonomuraea rubra]
MVATVVILVVLLAALIVLRGVTLARSRGSVPCRLRVGDRGWQSGVARYADGELHWIPLLGVRLRPRHAIARRGLVVSARREIDGGALRGGLHREHPGHLAGDER